MNRRDHRANAEAELEAEGEISKDANQRQRGGPESLAGQFLTDGRTDDFGADRSAGTGSGE